MSGTRKQNHCCMRYTGISRISRGLALLLGLCDANRSSCKSKNWLYSYTHCTALQHVYETCMREVRVFICIKTCIYICAYIHARTYTHMYIYVHTYTYIYIYIYTYIYMCIHICLYTYTYIYIYRACALMCVYAWMQAGFCHADEHKQMRLHIVICAHTHTLACWLA